MDITNLKNSAMGILGQGSLIASKYGPHVLVVAGVSGVVVSTVMACKATLKVQGVIDESNAKLEEVRQGREKVLERQKNGNIPLDKYTDEDFKKDLAIVHVQKWLTLGKLYAPAAGVGLLSVAAILGSHGIMTKRNAALMAAYKAVDLGYKKYRQNVINEFGVEKDEEFRFGKPTEQVEHVILDENDTPVKVTDTVKAQRHLSEYARFFDENSTQFQKDPIHNLYTVERIQQYLNDRLNSVGFVFLNEAYEALGIPRSPAGQMVGWKRGHGDGYIDFGIHDPRNTDFVNGYEAAALLDFNVDGVIYDLI